MRSKLLIGVAALAAATVLPLVAATAAGGSPTPDYNQATVTVASSPYGNILVVGGAGAGCTSSGSCAYPPGSTLYMASIDKPTYKALSGSPYTAGCGTTVVSTRTFGDISCTGAETDPTAEWPALTTDQPPVSGYGVIPGLLGSVYRADLGTYQVTYNGHPLYLFAPGAGNYSGANLLESVLPLPPWNTAWFLVSPVSGLPATGQATIEVEQPQPGTTYDTPQLAYEMYPNEVPGGAAISVYSFSFDTPTHTRCVANCMRKMIPVYTVGPPIAGSGVNASALGTLTRPNGALQVTYNGKALYVYSKEKALANSSGLITTGTAGNGQGVKARGPLGTKTGTFSLVSP
jgi:predicted lipoprotein with Yx(FWY)xxD motif